MHELTIKSIKELAEGVDLEAKQATGQDGNGKLPQSFFETYSAMANTYGGIILLGIREKPKGTFRLVGIDKPNDVKKDLWDRLNDQQQISTNLLTDSSVTYVKAGGKIVIRVKIPRAQRSQRPVYVGKNPLTGTYRRLHEGDYKCKEETVKRMLAEQIDITRDARVLPKYNFDDLDTKTIQIYRNQFKVNKLNHPFNDLTLREFLRNIGAWGHNRETGEEGLTVAGLLMFGKLRSILDELPYYVIDYQERPELKTESRWIDRLTTDGTWSGNLFDFYRRVMRKLVTDLKIPFKLEGDQRKDYTPVHEALREALVNTLIHADYSERISILVVKRPDMFGFRNPGTMRIPIQQAIRGGESDCRNRNLQKMFQLVGLGEQAGSGIPRIYQNWQQQTWYSPRLYEKLEPDQTLLELHMIDIMPEWVIQKLDQRFGSSFRNLSEEKRLALVIAVIEKQVNHSRLKELSTTHPHDLSKILSSLMKKGFLESNGTGRGTYYFLPGERPLQEEGLFSQQPELPISPNVDSEHLKPSSEHLKPSSEHLKPSSEHLKPSSEHLKPSSEHLEKLKSIATPIRQKGKAPQKDMIATILKICKDYYLSLRELSEIMRRSSDTLRIHYLNKLVAQGKLDLLHPDKPNHPNQRYKTKAG